MIALERGTRGGIQCHVVFLQDVVSQTSAYRVVVIDFADVIVAAGRLTVDEELLGNGVILQAIGGIELIG